MANENLNNWPVVDYAGNKVEEITLPGDLFNADVNEVVIQRAVRVDLSNRRVDTAHTLTRDIVHGSNRKPWRQKGTGRARAGTANSPVWRHGGVVHGPNGEQNHTLKMNKREHYIALTSALSDKAKNGNIIVLDEKGFESHKTKDFVKALKAIGADEKKNLLVLSDLDENLLLASGNIPSVKVVFADNVSVYDILNAKKLILVKGVVPAVLDDEHEEEAK
ncbi:MAG: 50S ribosomal protein L4 [Candidatus Enterosoma sp.]|nr:50S ribosomal protein L4 [Bacilli bacterium]MDD7180860.1 50S ribosomal protein L4 [Bacilli bacterium]MDY3047388.1 50S ribosomal protein L4 [Candidatus Enterosoma sp.]